MDYKLFVSKDAHRDVDNFIEYLLKVFKSPQAAKGFLNDIEKSYKTLVKSPHVYALCSDERLYNMGYRKVVIKNYIVLYRIDEDTKTVYVVRIVYGGRNYPDLL